MITRTRFLLVALLLFCGGVSPAAMSAAGQRQGQDLDRKFEAAQAQFEAGKYPEAASALEGLAHALPESFEVQELLGLAYAAQSQNAQADRHLEKAVRLKPDSASARTNYGMNLVRLGKLGPAEKEFKRAVILEPGNYQANHNLGELYARSNKVADAIPFLAQAQQLDPSSYDNGYDLALAYLLTGRFAEGRVLIQDLLKQKNTAELHNLLGELEEKDGNFVAAVNELETAAHLDPTENNLFDWGSELLLHRTLEPATEVFQQATERYPDSPRLFIGLGMAQYSLGKYDDAVKSLLRAAALNPRDPRCYPFLSRAFDSSPSQADEVIECFQRFAELEPQNGQALYYYAMSLWKGKREQNPNLDFGQIETLLRKSIGLDDHLAEAHLQLANLYSDQKKYEQAIPEYLRARELNADLADVHYRLAQAYVRTGQKDRAQEEFDVYQKLRAEHLSDLDRQRAEIRQFVYSAKLGSDSKP